jgi:hypothetical protein
MFSELLIWLDDQFGFYADDAFLKPMNASVSPKKKPMKEVLELKLQKQLDAFTSAVLFFSTSRA